MSGASKAAYRHESERVAHRLGLPVYGPGADAEIVDYCRDQVAGITGGHGLPHTLDELLAQVAACLDMEFFEVHSEDDLERLRTRYPPQDEPAIVRVLQELDGDLDAITIRRNSPQPWDRRYLAVINCRGKHYYRRYFTKWHELTHLLIEGEQLTLAFRKTEVDRPDPGEVLVDKIAAELAFFPDIVAPHATRVLKEHKLTIEAVDALRDAVVPEASRQAAALALIKHLERPAWYLRCAMSLKPTEMRGAGDPDISGAEFIPKLRVLEAPSNQAARESRIRIHPWMRVPESGIITQALESARDLAGTESISAWNISTNGSMGDGMFFVDCVVSGEQAEQVIALVSVADT